MSPEKQALRKKGARYFAVAIVFLIITFAEYNWEAGGGQPGMLRSGITTWLLIGIIILILGGIFYLIKAYMPEKE